MTVKEFMELLQKGVDKGIISETDKINIEVSCAYIQKDKPSKLENAMVSIIRDLNLNEKN